MNEPRLTVKEATELAWGRWRASVSYKTARKLPKQIKHVGKAWFLATVANETWGTDWPITEKARSTLQERAKYIEPDLLRAIGEAIENFAMPMSVAHAELTATIEREARKPAVIE